MTILFNVSQVKAIEHHDGPMLVLAGPGSGKTAVITGRVCHLVQNFQIPPEQILVATFSKAAAEEMRRRYSKSQTGSGFFGKAVTFGTLHSVFYGILKDSDALQFSGILTERRRFEILCTEFEKLNTALQKEEGLFRRISGDISRLKTGNAKLPEFTPSSLPSDLFGKIYRGYVKQLEENGLLDFDDILIRCRDLLSSRPEILNKWQEKYRYLLIDEFQDINLVQYETLHLLACKYRNLFIVGDDDQSIYGFRGADPQIMRQFLKDFPEAKKVLLNTNYRCNEEILQKALHLISVNKNRLDKKILPAKELKSRKTRSDDAFRIRSFQTQADEIKQIADEIAQRRKNICFLSEIAVLFRSISEAEGLLLELTRRNIPFSVKERPGSVFGRFIARDMIAYMKAAQGPCSRQDFLRIMNRPARYLSRDALSGPVPAVQQLPNNHFSDKTACSGILQQLCAFYSRNKSMLQRIEKLEADLQMLEGCSPYAAILYIRKAVGYEAFLKLLAEEQNTGVDTYLEDLEFLQESAKPFRNLTEWLQFIERYQEQPDRGDIKANAESVQIMTMHAAKGLEFDTVYLPCANQGVIPHKKAQGKQAVEEERRLFYVAMTRAKNHLFISWSETVRNKHVEPSSFLDTLLY